MPDRDDRIPHSQTSAPVEPPETTKDVVKRAPEDERGSRRRAGGEEDDGSRMPQAPTSGRCGECRAGHPAGCALLGELNFGFVRRDGTSAYRPDDVRGHFFGQSSFATHALATARNLVKVPRTLPLEVLAPLGCGLQTGAGTVMNSLAARRGHRLAVFGTGSVGLAAVMAARIVGAAPIVAVDVRPARLALARELGATHAVDARRGDVTRRLAPIAGGAFDGIVDTTGDAALGALGRAFLAPNGRLILLA
ncbi:MAG TPA: zinc-binding dehydrogenase, partial [Anaeromyxobacteraceae bacterium]|nr:zinc-binding dehydrogenase [Anaeromyxobacteraceae bacterium]